MCGGGSSTVACSVGSAVVDVSGYVLDDLAAAPSGGAELLQLSAAVMERSSGASVSSSVDV